MRNIVLFFLLCPLYLFGQDSIMVQITVPSPIIKFNPLSLIDPVSSLQFALEHPISKRGSLQHEVGYITRILYMSDGYKNPRGWRIRNEYRHYFKNEGRLKGLYFAPEFLYIQYKYDREGTFGVGCDNGEFDCDYYRYMDYTVQKKVFAFHPKMGYQLVYDRFVFDVYGGVGLRHVTVKNLHMPAYLLSDRDDVFSFRRGEGEHTLLSLSLGLKIGYELFKTDYQFKSRLE